jgi:hypothetical protein
MSGIANAYIQDVEFLVPLAWANKVDKVTIGSVSRSLSGNTVVVTGETQSQEDLHARCLFTAVPLGDVQTLIGYWLAGGTYSADLEGDGTVRTVRFDPDRGVIKWKHMAHGERVVHPTIGGGYPMDIYDGEINLIIES